MGVSENHEKIVDAAYSFRRLDHRPIFAGKDGPRNGEKGDPYDTDKTIALIALRMVIASV